MSLKTIKRCSLSYLQHCPNSFPDLKPSWAAAQEHFYHCFSTSTVLHSNFNLHFYMLLCFYSFILRVRTVQNFRVLFGKHVGL